MGVRYARPDELAFVWMERFIEDVRLRDILVTFTVDARTILRAKDERIMLIEQEYEKDIEALSERLRKDLKMLASRIVDEHLTMEPDGPS